MILLLSRNRSEEIRYVLFGLLYRLSGTVHAEVNSLRLLYSTEREMCVSIWPQSVKQEFSIADA